MQRKRGRFVMIGFFARLGHNMLLIGMALVTLALIVKTV
jgi:hypothetical protein